MNIKRLWKFYKFCSFFRARNTPLSENQSYPYITFFSLPLPFWNFNNHARDIRKIGYTGVNLSEKTCKILGIFLQDIAIECILYNALQYNARSAENARIQRFFQETSDLFYFLAVKCLLGRSEIFLQGFLKGLAIFLCTCKLIPFLEDPSMFSLMRVLQANFLARTLRGII